MEGNIIFKTSMRGFDKKEVMAYISEICEINAVNVDALERVTTDAKKLLDDVEILRSSNEELSEENAKLTEENKKLSEKYAAFSNEHSKYSEECSRLTEENAKLSSMLSDANKKIEELSNALSELNERATKVEDIEGAEEKANKLMMDSLRYSESCIKNARKVTASINMSTKKKISKAKDCLDTVSGDFKSLTDQIELSISEISERLANLSNGLDEI